MRRFAVVLILIIVLGAAGDGYHAVHAASPVIQPHSATTLASQTALVPLKWPSYGQAAMGELGSGVFETHNDNQPLPIASIAKIVTALCVLQKHPLKLHEQGPTITLTQQDVDLYNKYLAEDGSLVGVAGGEQISEYQALEGLLLPSGNNMADTLANWAFGSQANYISYADEFVKSLGMTHTHIDGASGFSDKTIGNAGDLVLLGEAAMNNPALASIVAKSSTTIPEAGLVQNYNVMLGTDGIVGIKTGNNDKDQGAFLFASKQKIASGATVTLVGVILGGPALDQVLHDSVPLIDSTVKGFTEQTVINAGDIVARYNVPWLKGGAAAVASSDLTVFTWQGKSVTARVSLNSLSAPVQAGTVVGSIKLPQAGGGDKTVPVKLVQSINRPGLQWRLLHP